MDLICRAVDADQPPLLFLTNTQRINKLLNKSRKREEAPPVEYVENFRVEIAKEKEYKGGRKSEKPFHFYNLLAHVLSSYDYRVHEGGLEADDYMCITQYARLSEKDTIICSRDKDLRQCPGFHYSWEVGKQASIGPIWVDHLGFLERRDDKKIWGTGVKFFYYQLLVGDGVDNIGGVKGKGPAFAYNLLKDVRTERECYELVAEVYVRHHGDEWKTAITEQANLLWMVREERDGKPVLWRPPKKNEE